MNWDKATVAPLTSETWVSKLPTPSLRKVRYSVARP